MRIRHFTVSCQDGDNPNYEPLDADEVVSDFRISISADLAFETEFDVSAKDADDAVRRVRDNLLQTRISSIIMYHLFDWIEDRTSSDEDYKALDMLIENVSIEGVSELY